MAGKSPLESNQPPLKIDEVRGDRARNKRLAKSLWDKVSKGAQWKSAAAELQITGNDDYEEHITRYGNMIMDAYVKAHQTMQLPTKDPVFWFLTHYANVSQQAYFGAQDQHVAQQSALSSSPAPESKTDSADKRTADEILEDAFKLLHEAKFFRNSQEEAHLRQEIIDAAARVRRVYYAGTQTRDAKYVYRLLERAAEYKLSTGSWPTYTDIIRGTYETEQTMAQFFSTRLPKDFRLRMIRKRKGFPNYS